MKIKLFFILCFFVCIDNMHASDASKYIVPDLAVPIYVKDNISEFDRTLHAAFDFIESQIIN